MQYLTDKGKVRATPQEAHGHNRPLDQTEMETGLPCARERLRQSHRAAFQPRRALVLIRMDVHDIGTLRVQIRVLVPARRGNRARDDPFDFGPRIFQQRQPIQPVRRNRGEFDAVRLLARCAAFHAYREQPVLSIGQCPVRELEDATGREVQHVARAAIHHLCGHGRLAPQQCFCLRVILAQIRRAPGISLTIGGAVLCDLVGRFDRFG
ncbi:hypothetical protein R70199_02785 [Paraburkholderia domus]|nr:hypothetical protein R70199_02785 [Paraburkholderia domus]